MAKQIRSSSVHNNNIERSTYL